MWLAPVQVKVLPISDKYADYAAKVAEELRDKGLRIEEDHRAEKIGYKIRQAQMEKVPYMIVVGQQEEENGTIAVRARGEGDQGVMTMAEFMEKIHE